MKRSCSNCSHYQAKSGECWGRAPLAQMAMQMNPLTRAPEPTKWTFFPQPNKEFIKEIVCGDYQARMGLSS